MQLGSIQTKTPRIWHARKPFHPRIMKNPRKESQAHKHVGDPVVDLFGDPKAVINKGKELKGEKEQETQLECQVVKEIAKKHKREA